MKKLDTDYMSPALFVITALVFCASGEALATHSGNSSTSGGTSTCKLCTVIDYDFEIGDVDVAWEFDGLAWTVEYTSRGNQTITGTVCFDPDPNDPTICLGQTDVAEFVIFDTDPNNPGGGLTCTGFVADQCRKDGRRDSLQTFTQQCGAITASGPADCVGRIQAATNGTGGLISIGDGIDIEGAAQLTSPSDCNTVFPKVKGKGGARAGEMGKLEQLHLNSKTCEAAQADTVDRTIDQRLCSSRFDGTEQGCAKNGELAEAGVSINKEIVGAAGAVCNPGTMNQICDPNSDFGKHKIFVTGAELFNQGVSPNDVDPTSLLCGNTLAPISFTIADTDGDGLDDIDARCFTCDVPNNDFLCDDGQCELTGTDGVQPFAALCNVILTP